MAEVSVLGDSETKVWRLNRYGRSHNYFSAMLSLSISEPLKNIIRKKIDINHVCIDAISESNPRVIDDARARKLAADLKRCSYYETCATYGLNVERVFQDGKFKLLKIAWKCVKC